ncbi:MAG TPA: guanylate kinase [Saprospiraceae bacterium]|nr:guanylate kinase [Saprospiraceae bacterium]
MSEGEGNRKLIVFTAPSGSGKTTVVRYLLSVFDDLAFSVSGTTRARRPHERHGRDYYFLSKETFKMWVAEDAFVEWEEVYPDQLYGTLKFEIERLWALGKHVIFDIDVKGAVSIKSTYPESTLVVFVKVPTLEMLIERLKSRGTESGETLQKRILRIREELTYESRFDVVLINNELEDTLRRAEKIVSDFTGSTPKLRQ